MCREALTCSAKTTHLRVAHIEALHKGCLYIKDLDVTVTMSWSVFFVWIYACLCFSIDECLSVLFDK